jgi:predicted protein tyrosine phosphatase
MELVIADVMEAMDIVKANPQKYRVVSIAAPEDFRPSYQDAQEVLYLEFDDVDENEPVTWAPREAKRATREDCVKALEFLSKGGNCLVHCQAGISRSTAIALGYLLTQFPTYQEAIEYLMQIRPSASPNPYVLKLMCKILQKDYDHLTLLDYVPIALSKVMGEQKTKKLTQYFPSKENHGGIGRIL